jgi:hypothetical protein
MQIKSRMEATIDKILSTLIKKYGYNLILSRMINMPQDSSITNEILNPDYPATVLASVELDIVANPSDLTIYKQVQMEISGMGADYIPLGTSQSQLNQRVYLEKDSLNNLVIIYP